MLWIAGLHVATCSEINKPGDRWGVATSRTQVQVQDVYSQCEPMCDSTGFTCARIPDIYGGPRGEEHKRLQEQVSAKRAGAMLQWLQEPLPAVATD